MVKKIQSEAAGAILAVVVFLVCVVDWAFGRGAHEAVWMTGTMREIDATLRFHGHIPVDF